ncbi:hypothetical protein GN956_G8984 [Arapaima gigas]
MCCCHLCDAHGENGSPRRFKAVSTLADRRKPCGLLFKKRCPPRHVVSPAQDDLVLPSILFASKFLHTFHLRREEAGSSVCGEPAEMRSSDVIVQ